MAFSDFVEINPTVKLGSGNTISFVEMKDLNDGQRYVYPSTERKLSGGARFEEGDTLFARITPCLENGKICQVRGLKDNKGFGSTEFLIFRGKKEISNNDFVFYLSRYDEVRRFAEQNMIGTSGRQRVGKEAFDSLILDLPPLPTQRRIAAILSALDDKIELNRRMNATLEGIAQALWAEWFGKYAKGEEELPEGWKWGEFGDLIGEFETGGRPKGGVKEIYSGIPSIGAESISRIAEFDYSKTRFIPEDYFRKMRKGVVKHKDILIYKDGGRPGSFIPHISMFGHGFPFENCAINEHVYRFQANSSELQNYIYLWLNTDRCIEEMKNKGTGVAIPGLNSTAVKSLSVLIPAKKTVLEFDAAIDPVFSNILKNSIQSRTLAVLRDALLPRLMRGEILS